MNNQKLMKWVRTNGNLHLEIFIDNKWKHYKETLFVVPDAAISSQNGFATAQNCLKNGYSYVRVIEVSDFLEHKTVEDLVADMSGSIVQHQSVELNLYNVNSNLMDKLIETMFLLRGKFDLSVLSELITFSNGLELYKRVLSDCLV